MTRSPARSKSDPALEINGWQIFAHSPLLDQLDRLVAAVARERAKKPQSYRGLASFKLLAALSRLSFEAIPQDPTWPEYREGRCWPAFPSLVSCQVRRNSGSAFSSVTAPRQEPSSTPASTTGRRFGTDGSKVDAYAVFAAMLKRGNPPDDWDALLAAAKAWLHDSARLAPDKRSRPIDPLPRTAYLAPA
jgi:toxin YhaV